ncbi:uncharacterized protein TA18270 [Theileria annulata]|uniref:Ribosome biogenesis protein BOP1 homolog n=1 Tax=Theileria annulata TaxID=5874 RepID=Q4UBJ6_THEAN|nr:uncharacterized protein TA18270 [Theileria annulata]CAI75805.1 hypothetical protein, conserved [Theileria annulata]|eukprot:XP_955281.1 hypothetical protein, conserved [Theileria annulata]
MAKKNNTLQKSDPTDDDLNNLSTRSNSRSNSKTRRNTLNKKTKFNDSNELQENGLESSDSDAFFDSDEEEGHLNRSGNVPIDWYETEDHIGYTVEGKKLIKELDSTQLGQLIFNSENPDAWRTIIDPRNNRTIRLTDDDLKIIRRIRKGLYPSETYDPEAVTVEFDNKDSIHPVSFELPPKNRFLPSKWEAMKVAKLVKLIKSGKIYTSEQKRLNELKKLEELERVEDIWKDSIYDVDPTSAKRSYKHEIKPPKIALPTNSESYNPPEEYLLNEEETKEWKETPEHERSVNYLPTQYSSMRLVPVYPNLIVERFNRCLQLLMCPRAVKLKMNVDPESLLPKLPSPSELGPYPKIVSVEYRFKGLKRLSVDCTGRFLALSSSELINICDVLTGRPFLTLEFHDIHDLLWHPKFQVIIVSHENYVSALPVDLPNKFQTDSVECNDTTDYEKAVKYLSMESPKGNYFVCVCPDSLESINQCILHCLPKRSSMKLGNKVSNNKMKLAIFHPSEPKLIIAFTRNIRVYNLNTKAGHDNKLADENKFTGVELPVSIDTNGTYLLTGDELGKLTIFDQEISSFPYKSFSFENETIIKVQIHKKLPLFLVAYTHCVKCFHLSTTQESELLFVPLGELKIKEKLTDCSWHNTEPWLYTSTNKEALMWA